MPTIDFLWNEWDDNLFQETDENNVVTSYVHLPGKFGELLYDKVGNRFSFYHFDGNGSTRKLTNINQGTIKTYIFSGFGELVASSGTNSTPFAYKGAAGYYTNPVTNDIYVRARTYEPTTGRWLSKDPLGFVDGPNLYQAYFLPCGSDPSGLCRQVGTTPDGKPIIEVTCTLCAPGFDIGDCFVWDPQTKTRTPIPCPGKEGGVSKPVEPSVHDDNCRPIPEFVPDPYASCLCEGWMRHCVNSCRAKLWYEWGWIVWPVALIAGNDLPWQDTRDECDVEANAIGIEIAKTHGHAKSCDEKCREVFDQLHRDFCCPLDGLGHLLKSDPGCNCGVGGFGRSGW